MRRWKITSTGSSSTTKLKPSFQIGFLEPDTIELQEPKKNQIETNYKRIMKKFQEGGLMYAMLLAYDAIPLTKTKSYKDEKTLLMHFKKCKETILTVPQIHRHVKTDRDNTFGRAINMQRTPLQNLVLEHKI